MTDFVFIEHYFISGARPYEGDNRFSCEVACVGVYYIMGLLTVCGHWLSSN